MGSDFSLINLQTRVPAEDQRLLQQQVASAPKTPLRNEPNLLKFPSNAEITDQVSQALDMQKKGIYLDRGAIVNILT